LNEKPPRKQKDWRGGDSIKKKKKKSQKNRKKMSRGPGEKEAKFVCGVKKTEGDVRHEEEVGTMAR